MVNRLDYLSKFLEQRKLKEVSTGTTYIFMPTSEHKSKSNLYVEESGLLRESTFKIFTTEDGYKMSFDGKLYNFERIDFLESSKRILIQLKDEGGQELSLTECIEQ